MKNIPVINPLRGIAASLVCFYHFVVTTTGYIDTNWIKDIFHYGSHGVQMFFVISGIVIPLSMLNNNYKLVNWGRFMLKRVARLEPPYLASILLALIYISSREFISTSSDIDLFPSSKDLFLHIGYMVPFFKDAKWINPVYWTLSIEFQYYLILSLIIPLLFKNKTYTRISFYLTFLALPVFLSDAKFFPAHSPVFLVGIVYSFYLTGKIKLREYFAVTILAILAIAILLQVSYAVAALSTILIIYHLPQLQSKFFNFLGDISYSLYLVHSITGAAFINFLSHRFREGYQKPLVILGGYIVSIGFAYLLYILVEKKSQQISKKITYLKHFKNFDPVPVPAKKA